MGDHVTLLNEWAILLQTIIADEKFCTLRNKKTTPFVFWTQFLKSESIAWTDRTRRLIYAVLALPIGSADAERGFSIMNHIRTDRRSRLSGEHLTDIMRIRINGPDEIEKFSASKYAVNFVEKENHYRTDSEVRRAPKRINLNADDIEKKMKYLPKSVLF